MDTLKKEYRDLEDRVLTRLLAKMREGSNISKFSGDLAIKIENTEYCEVILSDGTDLMVVDRNGHQYDLSHINLEVLIDASAPTDNEAKILHLNALVRKHGEIHIEGGGRYYCDDSEGCRYYFTRLMVGEVEIECRESDGETVMHEDWVEYEHLGEWVDEFMLIAENYDAEQEETWERCNPNA